MSDRRRLRTRVREAHELLGDDYKFTRDPDLAAERAAARKKRAANSTRVGLVYCSIRGCRNYTLKTDALPICWRHAVDIWEMVELRDQDPFLRDVLGAEITHRDGVRAEARATELNEARSARSTPDAPGDIYYARVGGLIKVGWTSDLYERVRSYGPDCELLVHYRATRRDETNLHRQLTPSRAKGREWYHDVPIIRAFVAVALRQHGAPRFSETGWTKPKQIVAGKRHK